MDLNNKKIVVIGGAVNWFPHSDLLIKEDVKEILIYDNFEGSVENLNNALKDPRLKFMK